MKKVMKYPLALIFVLTILLGASVSTDSYASICSTQSNK